MKLTVGILLTLYTIADCKGEKILSIPHRGELDKAGIYFASVEGTSAKNIIKTTTAIDSFACLTDCLSHPTCQSINFQKKGSPKHLCELSESAVVPSAKDQEPRPGYIFFYPIQINSGINTEINRVSSCKDIARLQSVRENKAYTIKIDNKLTRIYCHLTNDICQGGGWTLAMKINGSKDTFKYNSSFWSNKESYNKAAGQTGFDNYETKMPSYWAMPFEKLCVGFKVNDVLKWTVIPYKASSLYDVIADGKYRATNISKAEWMSLIDGSSLQLYCNQEGFNVLDLTRLGIASNNEKNCETCDSVLGLGLHYHSRNNYSSGNYCAYTGCSNINDKIAAFGFLMIQ